MPRYRLDVSYRGQAFHGWQHQPDLPSVQEALGKVMNRLGDPQIPQGAGRTDAGVHAMMNVCHIDLKRTWEPLELHRALRGLCPDSVSVERVMAVRDDFHARFDAVSRRYAYALGTSDDLFFRGRRWLRPTLPKKDAVLAELAVLNRENDFASLARSGSNSKTTLCTIHGFSWYDYAGGAVLVIAANRFLYGMVRALVGSVIAALEKFPDGREGCLEKILLQRDRGAAGAGAPAHGLYLGEVLYEGEEPSQTLAQRVAYVAGLDH